MIVCGIRPLYLAPALDLPVDVVAAVADRLVLQLVRELPLPDRVLPVFSVLRRVPPVSVLRGEVGHVGGPFDALSDEFVRGLVPRLPPLPLLVGVLRFAGEPSLLEEPEPHPSTAQSNTAERDSGSVGRSHRPGSYSDGR